MTRVLIKNVKGYFRLRIEGHAGYGYALGLPKGHDIVCAAVSILGQTAMQCMIDLGEEQAIVIQKMQRKAGMIDIRVLPGSKAQERLEHMVYPIQRGFELLQETYPDFISLRVESGVVEPEK